MAGRTYQGKTARMRIEAGLVAVLDEADARAAMAMWDREFAGRQHVPLIEFVNAVAVLLGLPVRQRHELRLSLYRELSPEASDAAPPPPVPSPPGLLPRTVVTTAVCRHLIEAVRDHAPDATGALLGVLRAGRSSESGLLAGVVSRRVELPSAIMEHSETAQVALVHRLYVAVCEAIGPVPADRMLAAAITHSGTLPEARIFPPRRLL